MPSARIDIRRLLKLLFWWLIAPLLLAVAADVIFNVRPWLTVVVSTIAIPLASIVVIRVTLSEFDKIIQIVAPELPDDVLDEADDALDSAELPVICES